MRLWEGRVEGSGCTGTPVQLLGGHWVHDCGDTVENIGSNLRSQGKCPGSVLWLQV